MHLRSYDFARPEAAVPPLAWLALLAGALLLAAAAYGYAGALDEHERLTRQIDKFERRTRLVAPARKTAAAGTAAASTTLAGRAEKQPFPWDLALREIELAVDKSVALTGIDTETDQRRTRIVAEARAIDDALAFVTRLRDTPLVRQAVLLAHERKEGGVIGFTLQIDWSFE